MNKKRTMINLCSSLLVLLTDIAIGFWLSPFIVKHIGVEANGFVTLANNFVMYASLIVTALNSMAARYIAIAYVQGDYNKANRYYNSVFVGNLVIVGALGLPAILCILRLEYIINIPSSLIADVKILFAFIFFNFFYGTAIPKWEVGVYVKNRLDRQYIPNMILSIFKCLCMVSLFTLLIPRVYYIGIINTILCLLVSGVNYYNQQKLTPELKINLSFFSKGFMFELIKSGVWNSISMVGNILLSGLDLIICNLFLGPTQMGILALSKIFPTYMSNFSSSIRAAFAPELTINFAKGEMNAVLRDINRAMKITSIIMTIPLAGLIVFGDSFFSLWVPTQDAKVLSILSILACLGYIFTSGTQILFNVFTTVNKVKPNAILMVLSGVVSAGATFLMLQVTDLGVFAVAGVSTCVNLLRNMLYTVPYGAKYLGFKKTQFYHQVFISILASCGTIGIGFAIKQMFTITNWMVFLIAASITAIVGCIFNIFIILTKSERLYLINKVKSKISKKERT